MIPVTCHQCGKKLKVKDELAGKKVRCPECKTLLDIPASEGATLAPLGSPRTNEAVAPIPSTQFHDPDDHLPPSGPTEILETGSCLFEVSSEIARGGMGAIMRAIDQDIHREVAVKLLLNHADYHLKARFVEEAQITGQLEHPNIVPIHQIGMHKDGRCFFSMKMVKGRSLADILKDQREPGTSATGRDYTLAQLLTIFAGVCNGMAYAHSRQVIHRDLKPANIMVGDFGEVYVMDWGLAKVQQSAVSDQRSTAFSRDPKGSATDSKTDSRVTTNRSSTGELTQAGSIMGTPAYMSPEQAAGDPDKIDERTDIYALGAILYEILTLTPPVGRSGDIASILIRVIDGKIDPPEERAPDRVKAGWIPPELSAIAMKALSKKRGDRYQTVAELQRDIQLFQEGRSVSAKQDSAWVMFKKLVKRNKGVSVGAAIALLVLLGSLGFILNAWHETGLAYTAYQEEQEEKRQQALKSVPALVRAARLMANENQLDDALSQANLALGIDETNADARLLRGQLLIGEQDYPAARDDFMACLKQKPDEKAAQILLKLCESARADDSGQLMILADELSRQRAFALADKVTRQAEKLLGSRKDLLAHYQKRLDTAWPGLGKNLSVDERGQFSLDCYSRKDVKDLGPLSGMKLSSLNLGYCREVRDLELLKGMKLTTLALNGCIQVRNLWPLSGMPLTSLHLGSCTVRDLEPLKGMPLTWLDLSGCQMEDLEALKGMPLTELYVVNYKIRDLKPLRGMKLTKLALNACPVSDLEPLNGMPLTLLLLESAQVRDLAPLRGMKLTTLDLRGCRVSNLEPLKGMPITELTLGGCSAVSDLEPLKGMPLAVLGLEATKVRDLGPLRGMKLTSLTLGTSPVSDLEPLKGMPLTLLNLAQCRLVQDLRPLKDMPLKSLTIHDSGVTDLTPLQGIKLDEIRLTPKMITQGLDRLRRMESLKIIAVDGGPEWPAAEFWKKHDAGEFKK